MKTLMVQGCTSDAGKTTLVAGLCRSLSNRGEHVAPMKPQNMALNSAVTEDGGEIGRAQALQAVAARVPLHTDLNPILLKPSSDTGCQIIVHGKALTNMEAGSYMEFKKKAMEYVLESHGRLSEQYTYLIVEGAGSPAEINLRANDIANMGYAEAVDCPVIIVADIDKGGVFAHLVGTLECLSASERDRVKGFVINKFRGDISLLQGGIDWIEDKTGKPVLGVLPMIHDLSLDAEDALAETQSKRAAAAADEAAKVSIAVLLFPHISNHTDFDPLRLNPDVDLVYVKMGQRIPPVDCVILPGSKSVVSDLEYMRSQHWDDQLRRHLRYGGKVIGICGGLQMLGEQIRDPQHVESHVGSTKGLGLLAFETEMAAEKTLTRVTGQLTLCGKSSVFAGYEIHCGHSAGPAMESSVISYADHPEGALRDGTLSQDGQIMATYVHGLFDAVGAAELIVEWIDPGKTASEGMVDIEEHREKQLQRLADVCEKNLNMDALFQIMNSGMGQ